MSSRGEIQPDLGLLMTFHDALKLSTTESHISSRKVKLVPQLKKLI